MKTYELYISGKVQGVYYRASTRAKAQELELTGYVENLPDGRVHAVVQGREDACRHLINWCRQGPDRAQVTAVDVSPISAPSYETFTINR